VNLKINNWVRVGFCLPHKVHSINSEMIVKVHVLFNIYIYISKNSNQTWVIMYIFVNIVKTVYVK
jgi:hypothetical protein